MINGVSRRYMVSAGFWKVFGKIKTLKEYLKVLTWYITYKVLKLGWVSLICLEDIQSMEPNLWLEGFPVHPTGQRPQEASWPNLKSERSQVFSGSSAPWPYLWGRAKPPCRGNVISVAAISDLILCVRYPKLTTVGEGQNEDGLANRALPCGSALSLPQKCTLSFPAELPNKTSTYF